MGISVRVESEEGDIEAEVADPSELTQTLLPDAGDASWSCLRFVDPSGATVFNRLQISALSGGWPSSTTRTSRIISARFSSWWRAPRASKARSSASSASDRGSGYARRGHCRPEESVASRRRRTPAMWSRSTYS